jgi:hypothetical protein
MRLSYDADRQSDEDRKIVRVDLVPRRNQVERVTLIEAGIDKKLSSRAQKLAELAEPTFEGLLEELRARSERKPSV